MVIRVRNEGKTITVPAPLGLARFIVRCVPRRVFDALAEENGDGGAIPLDKDFVLELLDEVRAVAREHKGLELVRVESAGGDLVSIVL